jgi:hypothetical protein
MIKLFKPVEFEWFRRSHGVYMVCGEGTEEDLVTVPVKDIQALVAMVPDPPRGLRMWCVVRKPGCAANRTGIGEEMQDPMANDGGE